MDPRAFVLPLSTRDVSEAGEFEGYLAVFGEPYPVIGVDEVVRKGAFKDSIKEKGEKRVMLWQHDWFEPIGSLFVKEDKHGLLVKGKLNLEVQRGREALALLRTGDINGLSMGFVPQEWKEIEDKKTGRLLAIELRKVDLWEGSVVTFPAQPKATIHAVRSAQAAGIPGTPPVAVTVRAAPVVFPVIVPDEERSKSTEEERSEQKEGEKKERESESPESEEREDPEDPETRDEPEEPEEREDKEDEDIRSLKEKIEARKKAETDDDERAKEEAEKEAREKKDAEERAAKEKAEEQERAATEEREYEEALVKSLRASKEVLGKFA